MWKNREALQVTNIRKTWVEKVGEASKLVVELHVEVTVPEMCGRGMPRPGERRCS